MSGPGHFTARYLARFRCIGAACEDTCCAGWNVIVDEPHYQALRRAMESSRAERARFRDLVQLRPPAERSPSSFAFMRLRPDGRCSFLDAERLCAIQKKHGEAALPDTCALYPRQLGLVAGRTEAWGALSCPELARLCLLADDAMELEPLDGAALPRLGYHRVLPPEPRDGYEARLDDVREIARAALADDGRPLALRLLGLSLFAETTAPFFHQGVSAVAAGRLEAAASSLVDPRIQGELERQLGWKTPSAGAIHFLLGVLQQKLASKRVDAFQRLVTQLFAPGGAAEVDLDPEELLVQHRERREAWEADLGGRLDSALAQYARHYWAKEWFTGSVDLVAHQGALVVRIALLRFLLFRHPWLRAPSPSAPDERRRLLEAALVDVVYRVSRGLEHDVELLARLAVELREDGSLALPNQALLLAL